MTWTQSFRSYSFVKVHGGQFLHVVEHLFDAKSFQSSPTGDMFANVPAAPVPTSLRRPSHPQEWSLQPCLST